MGFASRGITSADILTAVKPIEKPVWLLDVRKADCFKGMVGTWAISVFSANYFTGFNLNNEGTNTQNDEAFVGLFNVVEAAEYKFICLCLNATSGGEIHVLINGVDKGHVDTYAGATAYNEFEEVSLGSLTTGLKVLTLKISDKNASSSGYAIRIQAASIARV